MRIDKAKFVGVKFVSAADQGGTLIRPRWIVIHYTGGVGRGAIGTLTVKDDNYVSAHTFTDTDGLVTQLVSFDRIAYHAGASYLAGVRRLNSCTIGLELANPGWWRADRPLAWPWGMTPLTAHTRAGGKPRNWYHYAPAQIESAALQCAALMDAYGSIEGVVGHDDICDPAGRKLDPGPAWAWTSFRARVAELRSA